MSPCARRVRSFRARCAAVGPETSRKARRGGAQQRPSCSEQSGGAGMRGGGKTRYKVPRKPVTREEFPDEYDRKR